MSKIRAYTDYNERTNTHYYRDFTIEDEVPCIGDIYEHEEVKDIEPIRVDLENGRDVFEHDFYRVRTTFDGEYDEANEDFSDYYIAIYKGVLI